MKVYIVVAYFGADAEEIIGPYSNEHTANHVADAVETHFYDGGDQYTKVIEREVQG